MSSETKQNGPHVKLRILATSDLHAHLLPWDDLADRPAPGHSLAQVASLIAQARAEVPEAVLLDNGDFLNGSPLGDHVAETRLHGETAPHPVILAMNALRYDAATLGNHEFSHGLGLLRHALASAAFPVVATNLDGWSESEAAMPPFVMLDRQLTDEGGQSHAIRIGVAGFLPPQTLLWERGNLKPGLEAKEILVSAARAIADLRQAGADLVVVLAHSGLGVLAPMPGAENVALALSHLPGVDVVIGGHTHQLYPVPDAGEDAPGCALVMPGFFGSHLGVVDLMLAKTAGGWVTASHKIALRAVAERSGPDGHEVVLAKADPAMEALALPDVTAMRQKSLLPVGKSLVDLHSYFALIGHSGIQDLLAQSQIDHMRHLLRNSAYADLPLLAAVAPFKAGGRGGPENYTAIAAGALTLRNIADLYLHPNSAVALCLTGAEIALWLERAVSLFRQVGPAARDVSFIDCDFPAYNFDMIHGLQFEVDLAQPARFDAGGTEVNPSARRIIKLCHAGRPVAADQRFILASNSYRAAGGAGFAGADAAHTVLEDATPLRQVLERYVRRVGKVSPVARAGWAFAANPGASVILDSAPEAAAFADSAGLVAIGPQPSGFLRFRLAL